MQRRHPARMPALYYTKQHHNPRQGTDAKQTQHILGRRTQTCMPHAPPHASAWRAPVSSRRREVMKRSRSLASLDSRSFMRCASSITMYFHSTCSVNRAGGCKSAPGSWPAWTRGPSFAAPRQSRCTSTVPVVSTQGLRLGAYGSRVGPSRDAPHRTYVHFHLLCQQGLPGPCLSAVTHAVVKTSLKLQPQVHITSTTHH